MSQDPRQSTRRGTREQVIAETFVQLADTLVEDYDVIDVFDHLVAACLDLLQVNAAGLLLKDPAGNLVVMASSSEETRLVEIFQIQVNEGPCWEAVTSGTAVTSGDLNDEQARWPRFAPAALASGFQSVVAVPMRLRRETIGALNLFREQPVPVNSDDQRLGQALADIATIGILQQRHVEKGTVVSEQLQHALNARVVVEQAKGMLAERHSLTLAAAYERMRTYARSHNLRLTDVAVQITNDDFNVPGA